MADNQANKMTDNVEDNQAVNQADNSLDKMRDKNEEILQYNMNLFLEAIDRIEAAHILLSLKNKV
jgi:hypothetical protein